MQQTIDGRPPLAAKSGTAGKQNVVLGKLLTPEEGLAALEKANKLEGCQLGQS